MKQQSLIGFIFLLTVSCQKAHMISPSPQNYTCPLVMQIYFVVLDKDGKNLIASNTTSVKIYLPATPGVILDAPKPLQIAKLFSSIDTTKTPTYGGFVAIGASMGAGATFSFTLEVNGVNQGTTSYNLTRLGNYYVEGKGCFLINSIKFNGKPISYDTTSGILTPSFWRPPEGILIFQL